MRHGYVLDIVLVDKDNHGFMGPMPFPDDDMS